MYEEDVLELALDTDRLNEACQLFRVEQLGHLAFRCVAREAEIADRGAEIARKFLAMAGEVKDARGEAERFVLALQDFLDVLHACGWLELAAGTKGDAIDHLAHLSLEIEALASPQ